MWNTLVLTLATAALWGSQCSASTPTVKRAPTAMNSNVTTETPQFFPQHHSQRVKIRYGPFSVVSMDVNAGMSTYTVSEAETPCQDCLITFMQAGLEYPNGTVANADTNLWLHHTVFENIRRNMTTCPGRVGDMFFASGNERTPIDICANGTDQAGYYVAPDDEFAYMIELMNMAMTPQQAMLTVTWEYIQSLPAGFDQVTALWLDIGGCDNSSDQPALNDAAFLYTSPPWLSDLSGRITFMGAHLHDGGTHLEIQNNDTLECDCVAEYGQSPEYIGDDMPMSTISPTTSMSMAMPSSSPSPATYNPRNASIHLSNISTCTNHGTINPGDEWTITAYYNGSQHALMESSANGSLAPVMGIAILYVADNNLTTSTNSTTTGGGSKSSSSTSGAAHSRSLDLWSAPQVMVLTTVAGAVLVAVRILAL